MSTVSNSDLWERGGIAPQKGIGENGECRAMVLDMKEKRIMRDVRYKGPICEPQPLTCDHAEITWAEGGSIRLIKGQERWVWSYSSKKWEQGGSPPTVILQAVLSVLGLGQ